MIVSFDDGTGTLHVRREGAGKAVRTVFSEADHLLALTLDADCVVIRLTIEGADLLTPAEWRDHPDRASIPADMHAAVAAWLR